MDEQNPTERMSRRLCTAGGNSAGVALSQLAMGSLWPLVLLLGLSPTSSESLAIAQIEAYESGVGLIERRAQLRGPFGGGFDVARSHLDDLLKTIVVHHGADVVLGPVTWPTLLQKPADARSPHNPRQAQHIALRARGRGPFAVSYLRAVPKWRVSYRLERDVVANTAELSPWVLIHNDGHDDWRDVALELVSGRPTSVVSALATPRYHERPIQFPDPGLDVAQLARATPLELGSEAEENPHLGQFAGPLRRRPRYRSARATMRCSPGRDFTNTPMGDGLPVGFRYSPTELVTLESQHSLLAPLPAVHVKTQWVTLADPYGVRKIVIVGNSTSQTLPQGSLSLYVGGSYVGETELLRLLPGQRVALDYGEEVALSLDIESEHLDETLEALEFIDGFLEYRIRRIQKKTVVLRNGGQSAKLVYVALGRPDEAKITALSPVVEDGPKFARPRLAITVAAGATHREVVRLDGTDEDSAYIDYGGVSNVDDAAAELGRMYSALTERFELTPGVAKIRDRALRELSQVAPLRQRLTALEAEITATTNEAERLERALRIGRGLRRRIRRKLGDDYAAVHGRLATQMQQKSKLAQRYRTLLERYELPELFEEDEEADDTEGE